MLSAIACENHWLIDKQAKYVYKHGCGHMWVYRTASCDTINTPAVLELLYLAPGDLINDLKDKFDNVNEIAASSKRMVLQTARIGQFHYGNKPLTATKELVADDAIEYCDRGFDKSRYWVKDFAKTAKELVADGTLSRIGSTSDTRNLHWRDCMYNNA